MRKVKSPSQSEKANQLQIDIFKLVDFSLRLGKNKEMLNKLENEYKRQDSPTLKIDDFRAV